LGSQSIPARRSFLRKLSAPQLFQKFAVWKDRDATRAARSRLETHAEASLYLVLLGKGPQ